MAERERTNMLFAFMAFVIGFVYHEIGRRQALQEGREEERRKWVDGRLGAVGDEVLGSRERATARAAALKAVAATIAACAALAALLHTLGAF